MQTTDTPSVTQKFIKEGSTADTEAVYLLMRAMVSSIACRRRG